MHLLAAGHIIGAFALYTLSTFAIVSLGFGIPSSSYRHFWFLSFVMIFLFDFLVGVEFEFWT